MKFSELFASGDAIENRMSQDTGMAISGDEDVLVEYKGSMYEIDKIFYDFKHDAVVIKCRIPEKRN